MTTNRIFEREKTMNKEKIIENVYGNRLSLRTVSVIVNYIALKKCEFIEFFICLFDLEPVFMVDGHKIVFTISARGRLQLLIDDFGFCRNDILRKGSIYKCNQNKVTKFVIWQYF